MKHLVLTKILGIGLFLAFSLPAFAQFPNLSGKLVQGKQTTALGITSYSDTVPLHTPTAASWRNNTQIHRDTALGVDYVWRYPRWYANSTVRQSNPPPATRAAGSNFVDFTETLWQNSTDSLTYYYEEKQQCWQPVGTVVRDTTPVSTSATGTSAAVCYEYSLWYNSTNDSLYAYTAGAWLAIGSGGGGTAGAVDSIAVLQDSIIVGYSEGVEVTRDSIGYPAGIALPLAISDITGLADSLAASVSGTGTNLRIPVWTGSNSLGSSTLLQSATGVMLDANLAFGGVGGTTAARPTGSFGMIYPNTSNGWFDFHNGTAWFNPARSATTNGLFTAGSWLFGGSDGTITQNNSNFFVDNSNIRVGIGTASPGARLDISGGIARINSGTVPTYPSSGAGFELIYDADGSAGSTSGGSGVAFFTSYDRSAGAYRDMWLNAANILMGFTSATGLTVKNTGVAGFGTSSPANKVDIEGAMAVGTTYSGSITAPTNGAIIEGSVGIGMSNPQRQLQVLLTSAATNTVTPIARFTHLGGTVTNGFGGGIEIDLESGAGSSRIATSLTSSYNDVTNTNEDADAYINTIRAGTLTQAAKFGSNGTFTPATLTGTATQWLGATAGNILTTITPGYGLSLASGGVGVDTTALKAQFLPLTLSGTTTVNTAGQTFRIRDAGGYPDVFMNSNYWVAASDVNTFFDAGSTTGQIQINSAGRTIIAAAGNLELQAGITGEARIDSDSLVLEGVYPVGTSTDSVLVRDGSTGRVNLRAQTDFGTWLKPELEAGNDVSITGVTTNQLTVDALSEIALSSDVMSLTATGASLSIVADTYIGLDAVTNVVVTCDTNRVNGVVHSDIVKITDITNGDGITLAAYNSSNILTSVTIDGTGASGIQFDDGTLTLSNNTETVADTVTRTLGTGQQIYANGYAHYAGNGFSYASGRVTNASGASGTYALQYSFTAESTSGTVDMVVKTQIWDGATYTALRAGQKTMTIKAGELISGSHSTVITLPDGDGVNISFDTTNGCEISDFTYTLRKI